MNTDEGKSVRPRRAPGPRGIPIIGQALRYQRDPYVFFLWLRETFGDVCEDRASAMPMAYVFSPEAIEHVLVRNAKNYLKDRVIKSWNLLFGEGLLISEGDYWKRDRRIIQPAFHRGRIAEYQRLMEAHTLRMCESVHWDTSASRSINIVNEMTELTLKVAVDSLFGMEPDAEIEKKDLNEITAALDDLAQWFEFSSGAYMILTQSMPWFPYPKKLRYQAAVKRLDAILERIIHRKRVQLRSGTHQTTDLLGALITAKDLSQAPEGTVVDEGEGSGLDHPGAFNDRQVRDQALTFFLAGHETTSLALTYTLRLLALHPKIQNQLREQLLRNSGSDGTKTPPLLDQVIDESMRLFPPASVTARESIEPDFIQGYSIKKGTTVVIPTWAIHRDPRYFGDDVETFRPERWSPEFRSKLPRAAYLPFGFGPRMCIGFGFALQEMRIILTHLIKTYHFTILPENVPMPLQNSITMRPLGPVILEVTRV